VNKIGKTKKRKEKKDLSI